MNTSSLTGLVVVIAAAIWLGAFVPAWAKRGEKASLVREATRQIKQQARALKPRGFAAGVKRTTRNSGTQTVQRTAGNVDYRALYRAALEVAGEAALAESSEVVDDRSWTPRYMPAPLHTGHIGTLEQPNLAPVSQISPSIPAATAPAARPEESVIGENLDEILRRRRAV